MLIVVFRCVLRYGLNSGFLVLVGLVVSGWVLVDLLGLVFWFWFCW